MTRERVLKVLKENLENQKVAYDSAYSWDSELTEAISTVVETLEQQPSDCVSLGVYKQVMRERDIAIEQLRELGYEFGEKIRTSDDCVSREQAVKTVLDWYFDLLEGNETKDIVNLLDALPPVIPIHNKPKEEITEDVF